MKSFKLIFKSKFTLLSILFIQSILVIAQDKCKDALYDANKLFESGNIKECIERLEPCLQNKKGKEEKIESYHLLAQAYQNLNDLTNTQKYVRKMLRLKPDYQKFPNIDPLDFSRLVNQYKVTPKFYLGAKAGVNRNSVELKKSYAAYSSTQSYNPQTGFQIGATGDYRFSKGLSLNLDLLYSGLGINHIVDNAGGWKQDYTEQQNYFITNLLVSKYFKSIKDIQIYTGAGLSAAYLLNSNVFLESTNLETGSIQQSTQDPVANRNRLQTAGNLHLGIAYPLFQGIIGLETNVFYFFGETVNPDKRMDDLNFIFNNQYVNDDVSLRLMTINITYKVPLVYRIELKK